LILKAYDTARELRDQGQAIISGFHSPVEKDILSILMRGKQPIILCIARDLKSYRIPKSQKEYIDQSRLLLVSPVFTNHQPRITSQTAEIRNLLIAQISSQVLVIHAEPGGRIDHLCQKWVSEQRNVFALPGKSNQHLFDIGVKIW
jgi:predicted Rossmann fold nucleotide-binding protein DprA/Smf involved in DNA uptake